MSVPSWFDDPGAWDRLEINGLVFDTKVEVDGDFGNDFDVKKAPGADGATLTNKGVEPIKPSIKWWIYDDATYGTYKALINSGSFYPYPGKTPLPLLEVIHPQLQLLKKSQFRLVRLHALKQVGPQTMEARIDLLEYFPVAKPVPKPSTAPVAKRTREIAILERETSKPSNNVTPVSDVVTRPAT